MECYFATAHSDAWFLCARSRARSCWIAARSPAGSVTGIALLVASFWFKQHGALFVLGGLAYRQLRDGRRGAGRPGSLAVVLGPVLYLLAGPRLFGPFFHYFTWEVPRQWGTELRLRSLAALRRLHRSLLPRAGRIEPGEPGAPVARTGRLARAARFRHADGPSGGSRPRIGRERLHSDGHVLHPGRHDRTRRVVLAERAEPLPEIGAPAGLRHAGVRSATAHPVAACGRRLRRPDRLPAAGSAARCSVRGRASCRTGSCCEPAAHWVALEDLVRGPGRDPADSPVVQPSGGARAAPCRPGVHPRQPAARDPRGARVPAATTTSSPAISAIGSSRSACCRSATITAGRATSTATAETADSTVAALRRLCATS